MPVPCKQQNINCEQTNKQTKSKGTNMDKLQISNE